MWYVGTVCAGVGRGMVWCARASHVRRADPATCALRALLLGLLAFPQTLPTVKVAVEGATSSSSGVGVATKPSQGSSLFSATSAPVRDVRAEQRR